jgi:hypothetical protein
LGWRIKTKLLYVEKKHLDDRKYLYALFKSPQLRQKHQLENIDITEQKPIAKSTKDKQRERQKAKAN